MEDALISVVSAELEADLPATEKVNIDSVSGDTDVTFRRMDKVSINTVSGDVILRCATAPRNIEGDAVSGNVTIQLLKDADFIAKVDSISGRIGGRLLDGAGDGRTYTCGNRECRICLDSGSNDL